MTVARLQLVVRGRVQGVGFRWFVAAEARARGLAGWVRNLPDGSVELSVAGPEPDVAALRRAVTVGPPGARVAAVEDCPVDGSTLPATFTILRS